MKDVLCMYRDICPIKGKECKDCRHNSNFTYCIKGGFDGAWIRPSSRIPWDASTTYYDNGKIEVLVS